MLEQINWLEAEMDVDMDVLVVLITVPSMEVGEKIAKHLLDHRLAACVNVLPGVRSIYTWGGKVNDDQELLLMVKTRAHLFREQLIPAVQGLHPYDVPEILALPVLMGNPEYLDWVVAETTPLP
jgi:periplasmic divalent cation tolerance protein